MLDVRYRDKLARYLWRISHLTIGDTLSLAACTFCFTTWNFLATRSFSWRVPAFYAVFGLACVMSGNVAARLLAGPGASRASFGRSFLFGFFLVSTSLLVLALLLPFGLIVDSSLLLAVIVTANLCVSGKLPTPGRGDCDAYWHTVGLLIALCAATCWSQTAIIPVTNLGDEAIHEPWLDSYWHATQIRMFRDSHGYNSLQDFRIAGEQPLFYHYGGYLAPALLSSWTPTSTFLAFNSFMTPLGIFLTGLAASTLAGSWWGTRAGFGAMVALLLLPDASGLGTGSGWLGYHWLQTISPTGSIGVAVLAIAWTLMFEGCRDGNFRYIASSYLVGFLAIQFKAHLFVATAFLLWIYPPLFFAGIGRRRRIAWSVLASIIFLAALVASQRFSRIPLIRPGRYAVKSYMKVMVNLGDWGPLVGKRFLGCFQPDSFWLIDIGAGSILLFLGTFGLLGLACIAIASLGRPKIAPPVRLFPIMVMANYLMMALLLLPDDRGVATPEELQHRPLVWAYFVVASWVGGVVGAWLLSFDGKFSRLGRIGQTLAIFSLLVVPFRGGLTVQSGPKFGKIYVHQPVPRGLLDCCEYIRGHGDRANTVQDSENDPFYLVTAMSERQAFAVSGHITFSPRDSLSRHLAEHERLRVLESEAEVQVFATKIKLTWYLLRPGDHAAWSDKLKPAFESRGYRVYRLIDPLER